MVKRFTLHIFVLISFVLTGVGQAAPICEDLIGKIFAKTEIVPGSSGFIVRHAAKRLSLETLEDVMDLFPEIIAPIFSIFIESVEGTNGPAMTKEAQAGIQKLVGSLPKPKLLPTIEQLGFPWTHPYAREGFEQASSQFFQKISAIRTNSIYDKFLVKLLSAGLKLAFKEGMTGSFEKTDPFLNPKGYKREIKRLRKTLIGSKKRSDVFSDSLKQLVGATQEPEVLKTIATVIDRSNDQVTVQVRVPAEGEVVSGRTLRLLGLFMRSHLISAEIAYRKKELIENADEAPLRLLDDWVKGVEKGELPTEFYFVFESKIWESFIYRLNVKNDFSDWMWPAEFMDPFLPTFGVAVFEKPNRPQKIIELKRLFHNHNPDPLHLLDLVEGKANSIFKFYDSILDKISPGTVLEIHAHTAFHVRLYQKLGFKKTNEYVDSQWGRKVIVLEQTQVVLKEKISALLKQSN